MVGLPPLGYRITAHDGHMASCDGNKQAIAPVGVSPRRFSAVSDIGAFSILAPKSGCKRPNATRKQRPTRGAPTLRVPSLSGGPHGSLWSGQTAAPRCASPWGSPPAIRFLGLSRGVLGMFWACSERSLDDLVAAFGLPYNCSR